MTDAEDASEMARALAARRPRQEYACEMCRAPFTAIRRAGAQEPRTCSNRCRQQLHRSEKKKTPPDHSE